MELSPSDETSFGDEKLSPSDGIYLIITQVLVAKILSPNHEMPHRIGKAFSNAT